jgi:hypothetical protein
MVKDAVELTELVLETPVGGVLVMLFLMVLALLWGAIPTPREYHSMQKQIKLLQKSVEEKEAESREAHSRLDQVTTILLPTLQSIERRLDGVTPAERYEHRTWLPWNRED